MIPQNIIFLLLGAFIASIIFFIYHYRYRKHINIELVEKEELEKELITLQEREKVQTQNLQKAEEKYNERLNIQKEESKHMLDLQKASFTELVQRMEGQFQALSERITKQRSEELSKNNKSSMDSIINPLKETIEKMDKSLKENNEKGAERIGSLKEQINNLMNHTTEIGNKADHLSEALRLGNKIQGNWGETILETLLQSEGLEEYIHYETQMTIKNQENKSLRPDFVLQLPGNRAIVIDAKVSLKAYTDYYSAEDESQKEEFLTNHYKSIEQHIKELSDKEYFKHLNKEIDTPDFVIMFVPIPGALQLALQKDSNLYLKASKKGVVLSSTESLIPILWIIKDLWAQSKQEKNMELIVEHANKLLERLSNFFNEFNKIESSLLEAKKAYDNADKKIRGKQGALVSAKKIREAGIKLDNNKELPKLLDNEDEK